MCLIKSNPTSRRVKALDGAARESAKAAQQLAATVATGEQLLAKIRATLSAMTAAHYKLSNGSGSDRGNTRTTASCQDAKRVCVEASETSNAMAE